MSVDVAAGLRSAMGTLEVVAPGPPWTDGGPGLSAVAFPRSVDEAAEILERCSREGWTVLPAGAGGWLDGGGSPPAADLVVSTRRMSAVVEYEPADLTLTAEAGLTLGRMAEIAAEHGQWLAQDPPGWRASTLGAFVSTGIAGPLVAGYGRPRDHVLGLTAVSGDGRVLRPGGKVVKNVAGYDLVRMLAGSWGTLGLITGATVRLYPLPRADTTLVFRSGGRSRLVEIARSLATAPVVPDALTLALEAPSSMDGSSPGATSLPVRGRGSASGAGSDRASEGGRGSGQGERWLLAARLHGSGAAVAEKERIMSNAAGESAERLEGGASADLFASLDVSVPDGPGLSLRLSALPARLGEILAAADRVVARARSEERRVGVRAEATRGTVAIEVEGDSPFPESWAPALGELRGVLESVGGGLALLRGPRALVEEVGARAVPGPAARIMTGLKAEMDPRGILAPGRLERVHLGTDASDRRATDPPETEPAAGAAP